MLQAHLSLVSEDEGGLQRHRIASSEVLLLTLRRFVVLVVRFCLHTHTSLLDLQLAGLKHLESFIMAPLVFYLSASVLFVQSTVAFNCSRKPLYVDIHKRAVHDSPVFQYGSFIGLGTPAQNNSLWPSLSQNHTSFASQVYCKDNSTLKNCDRLTGGFFNNGESTS